MGIGDMVKLKSGGPNMVVVSSITRDGLCWVTTNWFGKDSDVNVYEDSFPVDCLYTP